MIRLRIWESSSETANPTLLQAILGRIGLVLLCIGFGVLLIIEGCLRLKEEIFFLFSSLTPRRVCLMTLPTSIIATGIWILLSLASGPSP